MSHTLRFALLFLLGLTGAGCSPATSESNATRLKTTTSQVSTPQRQEEKRDKDAPQEFDGDKERQRFAELVRANADDPSKLEIITWDKRRGDIRVVKFRCAKVGVTAARRGSGAALPVRGGDPVSVEIAYLQYRGDEMVEARLEKVSATWRAK